MFKRRKPPSPTWRSFLKNPLDGIAAIDFFVVPTATFRVLFVFVVLSCKRRRIVHFNVTANPSAAFQEAGAQPPRAGIAPSLSYQTIFLGSDEVFGKHKRSLAIFFDRRAIPASI
jgi:hypothetical protein